MPIPTQFRDLAAPVIVAPMFLVSGPDLVVETCKAGFVGTFPTLNQRTTEGYEAWLTEIAERLGTAAGPGGRKPAPYGVNLVIHKSNSRMQADLEATVRHKVPLVITSLGAAREVVDAIHSYGGLIFHDVVNIQHARKAAAAGVDGLIAVCAGAGGHAGTLSPFALIPEIREFFGGTIVLSGVMSNGSHIAAARVLGADMAYLGTRFIATEEAMAQDGFKQMIVDSTATDILYTPAVSGIPGNFLRPSLVAAGRDPDNLTPSAHGLQLEGEAKVWKDIWSAGQGVGSIHEVLPAGQLCARLTKEYRDALRKAATEAETVDA